MNTPQRKSDLLSSDEIEPAWWKSSVQVIVIVLFLAGVALLILALLGSSVGNVFSNIVTAS